MANFGGLQTRVQNRLIDVRTAVTSEIPAFINKAIRKLEDLHNFHVMESSTTINTTVGVRTLGDMPTDFKELRPGNGWYVDETGNTVKVYHRSTLQDILAQYSFNDATEVGDPRAFLLVPIDTGGGAPEENGPTFQIQIWPYPDGNSGYTPSGGSAGEYPVTIPYWKYLADLTNNSDQNWFTDNAEDFIVNAAVSEGFYMNWDEQRAQLWEDRAYGQAWRETGKLGGEALRVINLDKRRRMSATDTLIPRRDVFAPRSQVRE